MYSIYFILVVLAFCATIRRMVSIWANLNLHTSVTCWLMGSSSVKFSCIIIYALLPSGAFILFLSYLYLYLYFLALFLPFLLHHPMMSTKYVLFWYSCYTLNPFGDAVRALVIVGNHSSLLQLLIGSYGGHMVYGTYLSPSVFCVASLLHIETSFVFPHFGLLWFCLDSFVLVTSKF